MKKRRIFALLTCCAVIMSFASCNSSGSKSRDDSSESDEESPAEKRKRKRKLVAAANETAAHIKNMIDVFLTNCDTAGYGMLKSNTAVSYLTFKIKSGKWSAELSDTSAFKHGNGKEWSETGEGEARQSKVNVKNALDLMCIEFADYYPEIKKGSVLAYLRGGKCTCLAFTSETSEGITEGEDVPFIGNGGVFDADTDWCDKTGVSNSGIVIGTAPNIGPVSDETAAETATTFAASTAADDPSLLDIFGFGDDTDGNSARRADYETGAATADPVDTYTYETTAYYGDFNDYDYTLDTGSDWYGYDDYTYGTTAYYGDYAYETTAYYGDYTTTAPVFDFDDVVFFGTDEMESRVTSANSTAASMKNDIDAFLTHCDTMGYGMKLSSDAYTMMQIEIVSGVWSVILTDTDCFRTYLDKEWKSLGSGEAGESKTDVTNITKLFAIDLANLFPEIKNGKVKAMLKGGKCMCLAYIPSGSLPSLREGYDIPELTKDGWATGTFSWNGKTAGVTPGDIIVGTAPVVPLG